MLRVSFVLEDGVHPSPVPSFPLHGCCKQLQRLQQYMSSLMQIHLHLPEIWELFLTRILIFGNIIIPQVCSSRSYHVRDLRRIRRHLNLENAKSLASQPCALVTSRLDYCNSVLQGVAGKDLEKLQRVQNTLARAVTGSRPFAPAAPLLQSLHWLPIKFRIIENSKLHY